MNAEMELRKSLGYPPFASLIVLQVSGGDDSAVHQAIDQWALLLRHEARKQDIQSPGRTGRFGRKALPAIYVLGPVPAPVVRLRGQYRWRILVKATMGSEAHELIRRTIEELSQSVKQKTIKLEVDVDPVDLG
jgi:primosomal protein N' (replication factor Y)